MKAEVLAIFFSEGGKLVSEIIRTRLPRRMAPPPQKPAATEMKEPTPVLPVSSFEKTAQEEATAEEKIKKGIACLPCTNSHLLTCRGLLDEAHRMSHDGLTQEGMERVDQCLGEIAAAERVDLAPANIASLSPEEQEIARYAANEIRNIRHSLEGLTEPRVLEDAAAKTTELQKHISREYFKLRISKMSPEARNLLKDRLEARVKERKSQEEIGSGIKSGQQKESA
jgi:hypothetical protein